MIGEMKKRVATGTSEDFANVKRKSFQEYKSFRLSPGEFSSVFMLVETFFKAVFEISVRQ